MVSGPTRTCPCSMNFTPCVTFSNLVTRQERQIPTALTASTIFDMHMNTASRRRQNAATVNLLSTSLSFADVFNTPKSYNFDKSWPSMRDLYGS